MPKPAVFVGSSSEGLEFARAIRTLLTDDAEVTVWKEDVFDVGKTFIECLLDALPRFDFAILVLTPDDLVTGRNVESFGPRDNVIFELGLFMGHLGRTRTFIVSQMSGGMRLPTDLEGVTLATYDWPRRDSSYKSAVGAACDSIRKIIRDMGWSDSKASRAIRDIRTLQDAQQEQLGSQQAQIRSLQVALAGIVTQYELDKLLALSREGPFLCHYSDDFFVELKHLRAMNLVGSGDSNALAAVRGFKDRSATFDLKKYFFITEQGQEYIRLRRELLRENIVPGSAAENQRPGAA